MTSAPPRPGLPPRPVLLRDAYLLDGRRVDTLVVGDRLVELGPDLEGPSGATVLDAGGGLLLPAFVDSHVHLTETALLLDGVDLTGATSVGQILDAVAAKARARPGRPVLGHGWDEWRLDDGRAPTRDELDRAAGGAEVYLSRIDVHSALVSSSLAVRGDLAAESGWDDGGRVERDAHHVARRLTRFGLTTDERLRLQLLALTSAAAAGLGELHEMSAPHVAPPEDLRLALELGDRAGLPRVVGRHGELVSGAEQAAALRAEVAPGIVGLAGDLNADGSFGSRTAALTEDYTDAAGTRGHRFLDADQVRDHVVGCTRAGLQAGFHAIGDAAVAEVLAGYLAAAEVIGVAAVRAAGHRIEHLEAVDAAGIGTMARLGLTASVQPMFDAEWGGPDGMYVRRLGRRRAASLNPIAGLLAAGVTVVFGSDSPVTPFAPWAGVRAAMLHRTPAQRIGLKPALRAQLGGAAPVPRRGAIADLALWDCPTRDRDPAAGLTERLLGGAADPVPIALLLRGHLVGADTPGA